MPDTFALFDLEETEPPRVPSDDSSQHPLHRRIVADSSDRTAWLRARAQGITATDAAKLASETSVRSVAYDKRHGYSFGGSRYTEHGRTREPIIAAWVRQQHGLDPSSLLFHAEAEQRHLATPDGISITDRGTIELCEIKTTSKAWRGIPRSYLRQVWWQQYVLGAERTLVVWEQHENFVPIADEPLCRWVDRDDDQIALLVNLANRLLGEIGVAQAGPSSASMAMHADSAGVRR